MKSYEIYDNENEQVIGCLLYYEKNRDLIVELKEFLDEWTAPLLFTGFVKRGIYTIPRDVSLLWVRERVIPSGRQNISYILRNHKLKEYDEMKLLEISEGKSSQDSLMVRRIDGLPEYVQNRTRHNVSGVYTTNDYKIICFFRDDTVRRIDLNNINDIEGIDKVITNESLYRSVCLGTGGYYITFNDSIDVPASILYETGESLPIIMNEFIAFVENAVLDTTGSSEMLSCSRQNLSYMVKNKQITPIKKDVNGNLYLKDEIVMSRW